ncbi:hypothetical protein VP1G_03335 [Cytospora mali]|uniref:DUF7726 domain-containing protein n=1 Tax=Cytospora mali TaxID=578113 RepID=A0A194UW97_CYTMA|nr:hypothetical protein VP1G_03335 [Valsa mali var. pyri (nom. inval.)]
MATSWSWTPSEARALTSIDPNTVALQPAQLPNVHHQSMNNDGNNADAPAKTKKKDQPAPTTKTNNKKRKSDSTDGTNAPAPGQENGSAPAKKPRTSRKKTNDEAPTKASSKKAQAEALFDVSSVHLDDEDPGPVPVYETCDTIRRKIRDVLKKDGVTQAGFCRALAQACEDLEVPPQPGQLSRFLANKGPLSGNTNVVFYSSYVLFEKMRIRDRKPKSKFRQEMEALHPGEGVDIEHNMNTQRFLLHATERASIDKYGKLHITGGHNPSHGNGRKRA